MTLRAVDHYFWDKPEPSKSCMEALRHFILHFNSDMSETWKYSMPFYQYRSRRICYIWTDKKTGWPYLGIVDGMLLEHPLLIAGKRSRMKIVILDPDADLPVETLKEILEMAIKLV